VNLCLILSHYLVRCLSVFGFFRILLGGSILLGRFGLYVLFCDPCPSWILWMCWTIPSNRTERNLHHQQAFLKLIFCHCKFVDCIPASCLQLQQCWKISSFKCVILKWLNQRHVFSMDFELPRHDCDFAVWSKTVFLYIGSQLFKGVDWFSYQPRFSQTEITQLA